MATALDLSSSDIQQLCLKYLQANAQPSSFEIVDSNLKRTSDAPEGYLGSHFHLQVTLKLQQCDELKTIRFFCKAAPEGNASRMQYIEDFGVFQREITAYKHVLPDLQAACAEIAPKCYYADKNLLIFENLIDQGYRMGAGRDGLLNYGQLHCALKTLAALHAGSIIMHLQGKERIPLEEHAYPSNVRKEHMRIRYFYQTCEVFKELIKTLPKYQSQLDYILSEVTQRMAIIFELCKASKTRLNVTLHGDLWANNILFQYDKYDEKPLQCRFVDFQLLRYAPPAMDLTTMLTIPTTRQFRAAHLNELLAEYYRFMKEYLKEANLNIANILPEAEYYKSMEEYRIVGIIESLQFSHLAMLPPACTQELTSSEDGFNDFFSHKRIEICVKAFKSDELYRNRMTDMLEDFVDNYVLKPTK
ncbi:uncharacterized protein LOC133850356 [Drosophila sulfurigaster albostrigata]|uniref:uncharacterized protein LOC133850356 n=1 Tax=Drosophila sulfurigaster albostrigata TaxID=89887 RepID=UPI002D2197E2|nr:uncharacterized protein LOC133850356 [Drosophila sulfurigaster albostrigata]